MCRTLAKELAAEIRKKYFKDASNPQLAFSRIFMDKNITKKYVSDGIYKKPINIDGRWIILLPEDASNVRENFIIAHQLGYFFLIHDDDFQRGNGCNKAEAEASVFAAELLMPENLFREKAKLFEYDECRLGAFFGVSAAVAMMRLSVLHLDSPASCSTTGMPAPR